MAKVTIDDKEYDIENLSDETKAQLNALKYVQNELTKIQLHAAALQTARNAYLIGLKKSLKEEYGEGIEIEAESENIRFD